MQETTRRAPRIPMIAGIAAFLIHLACNPHYGFHRDELYFIVCGQHPAWNYVDQPAVAPLLAAATQVFGPSLFLLRAVPALFAGAGVYVTCLLVIELGGAAYAQVLAAFVVFFIPVLTDFGMKVSPDMVGLWSWPVLALLILRMTKGASPRLWLLAGGTLGLSINSKYNVIFFALALLLSLLLTPERRVLWSWWFVAGIALAALISLPAFLWQVQYGYPMLEVLHNTHKGKNVENGPVAYLAQQALLSGLLFWVWGIGVVVTLVRRGLPGGRWSGANCVLGAELKGCAICSRHRTCASWADDLALCSSRAYRNPVGSVSTSLFCHTALVFRCGRDGD